MALVAACLAWPAATRAEPEVRGWLEWRGPQQNGTTLETNLPARWERGGAADLWSIELSGRGAPVVAGDRVYVFGYRGEGADLYEVLACLDAGTGRTLWEHEFTDYLSDIIYDRYSIGAPSIDAETGNVYLMTTPGDLLCYTADGKLLWHHPLMEWLGRLTFPNGRIGAVALDGDLAIIHCVTANWGAEGPPRDRFYAFDKRTGDLVWASDPGVGPPFLKDNSFAPPIFVTQADGLRVFYSVLGDGNIVCVNARTGKPIWRYQLAIGGMNSAPLLYNDKIIAIHDVENVDIPKVGGMVAINIRAQGPRDERGVMVLGKEALAWRNDDLSMFSSSGVLVDGIVYQVDKTGVLFAVEAETGRTIWRKKLGTDQIHASPVYGDGKLYVPMNEGLFYILKLNGDQEPQELAKVHLEGNCLGAPAVWDGRVYVFTTQRLYCFGREGGNAANVPAPLPAEKTPAPGKPVALQILPAEVLMRPGEKHTFRIRSIDALGVVVRDDVRNVKWEKFIPPTARVRSEMEGEFEDGVLVTDGDAQASAGAFDSRPRAAPPSVPGGL
jgi:outer membrane protein assembly factor BamB